MKSNVAAEELVDVEADCIMAADHSQQQLGKET